MLPPARCKIKLSKFLMKGQEIDVPTPPPAHKSTNIKIFPIYSYPQSVTLLFPDSKFVISAFIDRQISS